ncbi:AraC family transcriptional regulator [Archangium violaceum]|nr:AraC family transcriptional regulator [Archangium violaceum]
MRGAAPVAGHLHVAHLAPGAGESAVAGSDKRMSRHDNSVPLRVWLGQAVSMSASVLLTRVVLAAAERAGVRTRELAAAAGLDLSQLEDPDARVPHPVHLAVWRESVARSGDECFGARVAELLVPSAYGVVGYAFAASATLAEAWERIARHSRLLYDEVHLTREEHGDEVALGYVLAGREGPDALYEAALASLTLNARRLSGGAFRPLRITLRHRAPPRRLPQLLGAPVLFGQTEDALVLAREAMSVPVRGSDPQLAAILERHAQDLLQRLPPSNDDLVQQVRRVLVDALPDGLPDAATVAARLGLHVRTLQRRLRERGLSLHVLGDEVRQELARVHLANPRLPLAEVAFLLGFSEPSAFHKAFRRWTGLSPGAFRVRNS